MNEILSNENNLDNVSRSVDNYGLSPESSFLDIKKIKDELLEAKRGELRACREIHDQMAEASLKARILKHRELLDNPPTEYIDSKGAQIDKSEWLRTQQNIIRFSEQELESRGFSRILEKTCDEYINDANEASGKVDAINEKYEKKEREVDEEAEPNTLEGVEKRRKEETEYYWHRVLHQIDSEESRDKEIARVTTEVRKQKQIADRFFSFLETKTPQEFKKWLEDDIEAGINLQNEIEEISLRGIWALGFDRSNLAWFKAEVDRRFIPEIDKINSKYDQIAEKIKLHSKA